MTEGKVTKDHGYSFIPLNIKMEVHNTSNKDLSVIKIIEAKSSPLV